jgi:hypothetical protein
VSGATSCLERPICALYDALCPANASAGYRGDVSTGNIPEIDITPPAAPATHSPDSALIDDFSIDIKRRVYVAGFWPKDLCMVSELAPLLNGITWIGFFEQEEKSMCCLKTVTAAAFVAFVSSIAVNAGEAEDNRQLIQLPSDIEKKMLVNMRDHIAALDEIIGAVESGEFEEAEGIAEYRLGWSSLVRLGDQEVANVWPAPMQKMADEMYRSASNFVITAQNTSVEDSKEGYRKVIAALRNVTSACRSCHDAFRVR